MFSEQGSKFQKMFAKLSFVWAKRTFLSSYNYWENQPFFSSSTPSVFHQPPHHLCPPTGSWDRGRSGWEHGKTGTSQVVSNLTCSLGESDCLCIIFVCVQVQEWVKKRLVDKFTPLSEQPQNVKDDLEKLQREVIQVVKKGNILTPVFLTEQEQTTVHVCVRI